VGATANFTAAARSSARAARTRAAQTDNDNSKLKTAHDNNNIITIITSQSKPRSNLTHSEATKQARNVNNTH
jgi:hypothetical protein